MSSRSTPEAKEAGKVDELSALELLFGDRIDDGIATVERREPEGSFDGRAIPRGILPLVDPGPQKGAR